MDKVFYTIGGILVIAMGLWGAFLCYLIVESAFGGVVAIISLFFFPALLGFAPWFALFAHGDFLPLLVTYGGMAPGFVFFWLGYKFDKSS